MKDFQEILDPITNRKRFGRTKTGDIALCEGVEESAMRVDDEIKLVLGEYELDTSRGVPVFSKILTKVQFTNLVVGYYRAAIMRVSTISGIKSIKFTKLPDHELRLDYEAFHESGETIENND